MEDSTTETDASRGNTLSVSNGDTIPQSADKKFGTYSRDFEKDDSDRLYHGDGLDTDINGADANISIVVWIKTETTTISGDMDTVQKYDVDFATDRQWRFDIDDSDGERAKFWLSSNGSSTSAAYGATDVADNKWHHIACVYDDLTQTIYVDGAVDTNGTNNPKSYTDGIANKGADFSIGSQMAGTNPYDGLIDDVGIFNVALDSTDVNDIMDNGLVQVAATGRTRRFF